MSASSESIETDVLIVGAGPAGASCATRLRQLDPEIRVVLADRDDFPRDKVCGDGLGPDAIYEIASLGATSVLSGYDPIVTLTLQGPTQRVSGISPAAGYAIPRFVLDERLARHAEACGARLIRRKIRSVAAGGSGIAVNGGEIRARFVVGADGAHSVVRRQAGLPAPSPDHTAVAIRGYASGPDALKVKDLTLAWPGGRWGRAYTWAFPVGEGRVNVGAGVFRKGAASRSDLVRMMADSLPGGLLPDGDSVRGHLLPLTTQRPAYGRHRVLLCGDAAGLVNPLSGEGIFYALASGAEAAEAIVTHRNDPAEEYGARMRLRFGRHFATTRLFASAADLGWTIDRAIGVAARDRRFFHQLADVALGEGTLDLRSALVFSAAVARQKGRSRR